MDWPACDEGSCAVGERPARAPAEHKTLPPCEPGPATEPFTQVLLRGSGVPLHSIEHAYPHFNAACLACKGTETRCIFFEKTADMVERTYTYELECGACGKFSLFVYWT